MSVAAPAARPLSIAIAQWALGLTYADIPADVVRATRLRILDVMGLALAGCETPFGRGVREATLAMSPSGPSAILGSGDRVGATAAAFANASFSQALEFDD